MREMKEGRNPKRRSIRWHKDDVAAFVIQDIQMLESLHQARFLLEPPLKILLSNSQVVSKRDKAMRCHLRGASCVRSAWRP